MGQVKSNVDQIAINTAYSNVSASFRDEHTVYGYNLLNLIEKQREAF